MAIIIYEDVGVQLPEKVLLFKTKDHCSKFIKELKRLMEETDPEFISVDQVERRIFHPPNEPTKEKTNVTC